MAVEDSMGSHMAEDKPNNPGALMSKMEPSVLDSFSKLTSVSEKQRVSAGMYILNHLFHIESDNQTEGICVETTYALNRLIRGVGSSRLCSRAGFFSTLVGLLSSLQSIKFDDVAAAIKKELQTGNSKTKGELGDIYSGRVLVYGAIIQSGLFMRASKEQQMEILTNLLQDGNKRSYLPLVATVFIVQILDQVDESNFKDSIWPILKKELGKPWANQTLETLYLMLLTRRRFPGIVKKKFLINSIGTAEIAEENSAIACSQLLMDIPVYNTLNHPVYEEFCSYLVDSEHLTSFWQYGIDAQLAKPSSKKILIVVKMMSNILKQIKDKCLIPDLLTPNFITQIIKSYGLRNTEASLSQKIQELLTLLTKTLEEDVTDKVRLAVVKKLIIFPGELFFEKYSGTKTIQMISRQLNADGAKKLAKLYKQIVSGDTNRKKGPNDEDTQPWTGLERLYAAQMFTRLLNHPALQSELDWKAKQLQFLVNMGLFKSVTSESESSVRASLSAGVKDCFFRALDQRLPKLDDLRSLLSRTVHYINEQAFGGEQLMPLKQPLSEKAMKSWKKMYKVVEHLEQQAGDGSSTNTKEKNISVIPVFHTTFLHMGLQLFVDPEMAGEALEELHSCLEHTSNNRRRKSRRLEEARTDGGEPHWVEVAVDLLLSLLSHDSHLLRSLVSCVFPHLCPHLTPTALHQILDVLDPNSDENPLGTNEDDDSSEDDEAFREHEKIDKECTKNGKSEMKHTDSATEESESDEMSSVEESDDGGEEEMRVNDKLRMAVQQALGSAATQTDTESVDLDEMDEQEGKRLDAALSEAFSLLKKNNAIKKSKKQTRDERTVTHFRIRVIDLLDVYLAGEPDMALCLDMMLPLFELLEFCIRDPHQKPLEIRVGNCLKKLSAVKKFSSVDGVNQKTIADFLSKMLDKGERTAPIYMDMLPKITMCSAFLVRCSDHLKEAFKEKTSKKKKSSDSFQDIEGIYKSALENFFTKRDCLLQIHLFKSVIQTSWDGNWTLAPLLVQFAFDPAVRPFRRNQAFELLTAFYRNDRLLTAANEQRKELLKNMELSLSENSIQILTRLSALEAPGTGSEESVMVKGIKQKFVCELMKLLFCIRQLHVHRKYESNVDWESLGSSISLYREAVELATDTKITLNRLCNALGLSASKQKKLKRQRQGDTVDKSLEADETVNETQGSEHSEAEDQEVSEQGENENVKLVKRKEKKKHKLSKSKAALRKEAKQLRLQALSVGLEDSTFSNVNVGDLGKIADGQGETAINMNKQKHSVPNGHINGDESVMEFTDSSSKKRKQREVIEGISKKNKKRKLVLDT